MQHCLSRASFLVVLYFSHVFALAIAAAAAAIDPVHRNNLVAELRAREAVVANDYCAVCYESIADYRANVFQDKAGLYVSTPVDDDVQPVAALIRERVRALSEEKYGGNNIPKDQRLAICSALLKGFTIDVLRMEATEKDPRHFSLLLTVDPELRKAALEQYIDELARNDQFNCEKTFALVGGGAQ